jgi:cytochrome o ubiquinol oxidase subunit 2
MCSTRAVSIPACAPVVRGRQTPGKRRLRAATTICCSLGLLLLGGCNTLLLNPKGDIGVQEKNLILIASGLMLLVIVPVIFMALYFAWRYRASNPDKSGYAPTWAHSTPIEAVCWAIPIIIIVVLGVLGWRTTHSLDPYQPLASTRAPLRVEVVALNWKWLFIYPDLHLASVNELHIPVDTPVDFKITAASLMNSFFIPSLGSQVYAMPGMQTELHLIANQGGVFPGISAAFSGPGFADMGFNTVATSQTEFDAWAVRARQAPQRLDRASYAELARDSVKQPVASYGDVDPALFGSVVAQYMGDPHDPSMAMPPAAVASVCRAPRASPAPLPAPLPRSLPALSLAKQYARVQE